MKNFVIKYIKILISSGIGLLIFQLKFGFEKLVPSNINWLLKVKHDWGQHYLGWSFYRIEPWHFPIGKIENYYYPISTNIGFTDSIPLLAIPFKLVSNFLSDDFQYFGIWFLSCFILTAYFSIKILKKYKFNWFHIVLITVLITANPVLLFRTLHPALCSQWLILASIYLYFKETSKENVNRIYFYQFILLMISALVHPYMVLIILGFTLVLLAKIFFFNKLIKVKQLVFYLLFSFLSLLIVWYLVGYFTFTNSVNNAVGNAFGLYSMNFNTFYNSFGYSSILPNYSLVTPHQYEGFMYLGVGILVFIFITCILLLSKIPKIKITKKYNYTFPLLAFCLFCLLFSIKHKVSFNENILFEIDLPTVFIKFGNIFRASSRTFWVNYYLLLMLFFILFSKLKISSTVKSIILVSVVFIQFYDIQTFFIKKDDKFGTYVSSLNSERWESLFTEVEHLNTFPPYHFINFGTPYEYQDLAYLASKNNLSHTNAYVARSDSKSEQDFTNKMISDLITKPIAKNEIYVTNKEYISNFTFQISKFNSNISYLDGYFLIYSGDKKPLTQTKEENLILSSSKQVLNSRSFKKFENEILDLKNIKSHIENIFFTQKYIKIDGWAFIEKTTDNSKDSLFLILYNSEKKYFSKLNTIVREDVTSAYNIGNLDNSGIKSINFFNNVDKGSYNIALGIKDKNDLWSYSNLNKKINVDEPAYPYPIKIQDTLISKKNIHYNIESVEQVNDFIFFEGWAFIKDNTSENSEVFIILRGKNQTYKITTKSNSRPDVYDHFKREFNYSFSGFESKFEISNIPKEEYQIGIQIKNSKLEKEEFILTNRKIVIR